MEDFRNNYKVEKALKTELFQDRARIQVGRISMFGLLELSRQRLRSSLIELSYQKCHYCSGSGVILNPNFICEQIIKVVEEKLINNKNSSVQVKCNTSLADVLLNTKRNELNSLEEKHNSKILFDLNSLFSLHNPEVTLIDDSKNLIQNKNNGPKTNMKKNVTKKKSEKIKNSKKNQKKIKKNDGHKEKKEELSESKKISKKTKEDEKTGWWANN